MIDWHHGVLLDPDKFIRYYVRGSHLTNKGKRFLWADPFDRSSVVTTTEDAEVYKLLVGELQPLQIHVDRGVDNGSVNDFTHLRMLWSCSS